MQLSVYVFGMEELESREVEEMLSALDEVDTVSTTLSRDRIRPGVIYASAEFVHYSIKLAEFIIGGVALGGLNEAGKQLYLASSECVRTRLRRWTEERNAEARRDRIHFTLSEAGEMLVSMESKKTSE
jgi:hypothetical protein